MGRLAGKKFCINCGSLIGPGVQFCENCGTPISSNGTQNISKQVQQQSSPVAPVANVNTQPASQPVLQPESQSEPQSASTPKDKGYFSELKSFSCQGRINRAKYWKYAIYTSILSVVSTSILGTEILAILLGIASIPFAVRRLHDLNRSGWFLLIVFIPLVNILLAIYAGFFKGTDGPNDYGPDPLQQ